MRKKNFLKIIRNNYIQKLTQVIPKILMKKTEFVIMSGRSIN